MALKKILIIGDDAHGVLSSAIVRQLEKMGQTVEIATLLDREAYEGEKIIPFEIMPQLIDPITSIDIIQQSNEPFYRQIGKKKGKKGYRKW